MPVINLPKDTRFAELGEGLGKLLEGAINVYTTKKADEVVAQVVGDIGVSELDKGKQIFKLGGKQAYDRYKEYLGVDVLKAGIEEKLAGAYKDRAAAGKPNATLEALGFMPSGSNAAPAAAPMTAQVLGNTAPAPQATPTPAPAAPTTASVLGGAPAPSAAPPGVPAPLNSMMDNLAAAGGVTLTPVEKQGLARQVIIASQGASPDAMKPVRDFISVKQGGTMLPGAQEKQQLELSAQRGVQPTVAPMAQNALTQSNIDTAAKQQVGPTTGPRARADLTTAENAAREGSPAPAVTPGAVGDVYEGFTPEQNKAVASAYRQSMKAGKALEKEFVAANTAAGRSGDAEMRTKIMETSGKTAVFSRVMDDIEKNPRLNGGLFEAVAYPVLAKYGFDFGQIPPALYAEGATSDQLALQAVSGHRGFGGQYLVSLVNKVMPTVAKQKLLKAIESNFIAEQHEKELSSLKLAAQDKGQNTAQLDAALEQARELYRRTSTLWWTGGDKPRVFYKGREINPDTWLPVEGGAREFDSKEFIKIGNDTVTGAQLNDMAKRNGVTPEEFLAGVRAGIGGSPVGQNEPRGPTLRGLKPAPTPPTPPPSATRPTDLLPESWRQ